MHCGHVNPLPGGRKPGRTVSCKLCARMFGVEAAAAHVPAPPPEAAPPPPGMTPHTPDAESVDAPTAKGPLIYTPAPATKKRASKSFRLAMGAAAAVFLIACVVALAVMVPSLNRTSAAARRAACAANLRRVASAIALYANQHHGAFPDSFARLTAVGSLPPDALICPGGDEMPAPGVTPRARAETMARGKHASYTYFARSFNRHTGPGSGTTAVVACEPLAHHRDGVHVLYADGHVAFVPTPDAKRLIGDLNAGKNPPGAAGR